MSSYSSIEKDLAQLASPQVAEANAWFFKTGPGEYGEGDQFRGIRVPPLRRLAKKYQNAPLELCERLLQSVWHEDRLLGLLMMVRQYERGDDSNRRQIYNAYRQRIDQVNNWDLVDSSAPGIVGAHLFERSRRPLHTWARSRSMWRRRIAIIATYYFIKRDDFETTLLLAEQLRDDREDLLHKAVGWMIREVGNRDRKVAESFLRKHYRKMPRTALRYAIERLPAARRKQYLEGKIR